MIARVPPGKEPLLGIIGIVENAPEDLAERHDDYLAEAYADNYDSFHPMPKEVAHDEHQG